MIITFNESSNTLKQFMFSLGWDLDRLEKEGMIKILDFVAMSKVGLQSAIDTILEEARFFGAKRMVIDSITALTLASSEKQEVRTTISVIQKLLRKIDCTTFLISEKPWGEKGIGSCVEEFIADGIILLETSQLKES